MDIVKRDSGKFEQVYITGGDAVMYFPSVLKTKKKYQSDDKQYEVTLFVDTATREKLELPVDDGGAFLNKQFYEVGVDKNKKKKVKFPTSDQVGEDDRNFDSVKGMHGFSLTAPEFKKNGDKSVVAVVDADGNPWDKTPIGTGSKGNFRMWGYRNEDGQLVVTLDLVQVTELVEGQSGGNGGFDDVLGINLDNVASHQEADAVADIPSDFNPDDDDIPF